MSIFLIKIFVEKFDDVLSKLEDESKDFKCEKFIYKELFIKDNLGRMLFEVLVYV